jgi:hypothetical protein
MEMVISCLKSVIMDDNSGACAHSCARRMRDVSRATLVVSLVEEDDGEERAEGRNVYECGLEANIGDGLLFTHS